MNFIGVDLHKKLITVCVMNQNLKVTARKTLSCDQPDQIVEFFRQFRPFKVVVEATASYLWLVELKAQDGQEITARLLASNQKRIQASLLKSAQISGNDVRLVFSAGREKGGNLRRNTRCQSSKAASAAFCCAGWSRFGPVFREAFR